LKLLIALVVAGVALSQDTTTQSASCPTNPDSSEMRPVGCQCQQKSSYNGGYYRRTYSGYRSSYSRRSGSYSSVGCEHCCLDSECGSASSCNQAAIIGSVIGGICLMMCCCGAAAFFYFVTKNNQNQQNRGQYVDTHPQGQPYQPDNYNNRAYVGPDGTVGQPVQQPPPAPYLAQPAPAYAQGPPPAQSAAYGQAPPAQGSKAYPPAGEPGMAPPPAYAQHAGPATGTYPPPQSAAQPYPPQAQPYPPQAQPAAYVAYPPQAGPNESSA